MKLRIIIAILLLAPMALAQTTLPLTYEWAAPEGGSPVVHYDVWISLDGGEWLIHASTPDATPHITIDAEALVPIRIRVAGVDAQGRAGPVSNPSISHTPDPGPPGACGIPVLMSR